VNPSKLEAAFAREAENAGICWSAKMQLNMAQMVSAIHIVRSCGGIFRRERVRSKILNLKKESRML
jgi:hypothetical protein